jgi:hypothetical protein
MNWLTAAKEALEQHIDIAECLELGTRHAIESSWHAVECGRNAGLSVYYFWKAFHGQTASTIKVVAVAGTAVAVSYVGFDLLRLPTNHYPQFATPPATDKRICMAFFRDFQESGTNWKGGMG